MSKVEDAKMLAYLAKKVSENIQDLEKAKQEKYRPCYGYMGANNNACPTRIKSDLRYIRRLALELME